MAFQSGNSGNPEGQKRAKLIRESLTRAVLDDVNAPLPPKSKLDAIIAQHLEKALEGDISAIKEIYDRIDGKVPQAVVGGDDDDNPIKMLVSRIELVAPSLEAAQERIALEVVSAPNGE